MPRKASIRLQDAIEQGLFPTGEIMKRSGLSRQVLYQYTAMGLIKESKTTRGGYRLYPAEETLKHLKVIKALKASGYTLRDIKDVFFSRVQPS